ncbi:MAG: hypothetical protein LBQ43_01585 [Holosporales bacterium]|jgi:hypothetical protein|nr:hypothetical protein [Holosporales bacterium]
MKEILLASLFGFIGVGFCDSDGAGNDEQSGDQDPPIEQETSVGIGQPGVSFLELTNSAATDVGADPNEVLSE